MKRPLEQQGYPDGLNTFKATTLVIALLCGLALLVSILVCCERVGLPS